MPRIDDLESAVTEQGSVVRGLKEKKAAASEVDAAVALLKGRKAELTAAVEEAMANVASESEEYAKLKAKLPGAPRAPKKDKAAAPKKEGGKKDRAAAGAGGGGGAPMSKDAGRVKDADEKGMTYTREGNWAKWYEQVITKSEMIECTPARFELPIS